MRPFVPLTLSLLFLGCTVVVDAPSKKKPKKDALSDSVPSDGTPSDLSDDAATDLPFPTDVPSSDTLNDIADTTPDLTPSDTPPSEVLADVLADGDSAPDTESEVGEVVEEDIVAPPDVIIGAGWYKLDTADDLLMNVGQEPIVGTLVISQDHAAIFPVDLTVPEKNILALTPDTMLLREFPFACLGNDTILKEFNGVTQPGPSGTLKLLQGNPVAEVLSEGPQVSSLGSSVVDRIEIEMPFKVPQDDTERMPKSLCYGVRSQGDWYFSFEAVQAQLDDLNKKGTVTLEIGFPAKVDAIAVITGQNIGVDWIRFRTK